MTEESPEVAALTDEEFERDLRRQGVAFGPIFPKKKLSRRQRRRMKRGFWRFVSDLRSNTCSKG